MKKLSSKKTVVRRRRVPREDVLQYIYTKVDGKPASFRDVARALAITLGAASIKLFRLNKQGLVAPTSDAKIRPYYYMLTNDGLKRLKAAGR